MSRVFVDTSAIFALLVSSDVNHPRAKRTFRRLESRQATLVSSSYVLVETYALVGRRLGLGAVVSLRNDFAPLLEVLWVNADMFESSLASCSS